MFVVAKLTSDICNPTTTFPGARLAPLGVNDEALIPEKP